MVSFSMALTFSVLVVSTRCSRPTPKTVYLHACVFRVLSNCFTSSRERADEFGGYILIAEVPLPKILFFNRLLPGMLKGEDEFVASGGMYEVSISTL